MVLQEPLYKSDIINLVEQIVFVKSSIKPKIFATGVPLGEKGGAPGKKALVNAVLHFVQSFLRTISHKIGLSSIYYTTK